MVNANMFNVTAIEVKKGDYENAPPYMVFRFLSKSGQTDIYLDDQTIEINIGGQPTTVDLKTILSEIATAYTKGVAK